MTTDARQQHAKEIAETKDCWERKPFFAQPTTVFINKFDHI